MAWHASAKLGQALIIWQAWFAVHMQDRGSKALLSPEDMKRIVGPGAYDQHGKGNVNVGDGGVAFLLASAGAIPGGAPLVSPTAICMQHIHSDTVTANGVTCCNMCTCACCSKLTFRMRA